MDIQERLFNELMEISDYLKKEKHFDCEESFLTSCNWCGEDICLNCGMRAELDCPTHGKTGVN
jgi:hypothetical protein